MLGDLGRGWRPSGRLSGMWPSIRQLVDSKLYNAKWELPDLPTGSECPTYSLYLRSSRFTKPNTVIWICLCIYHGMYVHISKNGFPALYYIIFFRIPNYQRTKWSSGIKYLRQFPCLHFVFFGNFYYLKNARQALFLISYKHIHNIHWTYKAGITWATRMFGF